MHSAMRYMRLLVMLLFLRLMLRPTLTKIAITIETTTRQSEEITNHLVDERIFQLYFIFNLTFLSFI